jgi:hypothetical protein
MIVKPVIFEHLNISVSYLSWWASFARFNRSYLILYLSINVKDRQKASIYPPDFNQYIIIFSQGVNSAVEYRQFILYAPMKN